MIAVTVKFPDDIVAYVRRLARQRHIREAQVWRELVTEGIQGVELNAGLHKTAFNLAVQNLCISRRVAGHLDESLIELAREDARRTLQDMEVKQ